MVLDDDHMLGEILVRLVFPTSLVRAALVCRRWLRVASNPNFLRRFRDLHPPHLVGFYVEPAAPWFPKFVPMANNPPAELAAVVRRAGSAFDAYAGSAWAASNIWDCQNGRLFVRLFRHNYQDIHAVLSPLDPVRDAVILSPPLWYPTAGYGRTTYNSGFKFHPAAGRGGSDVFICDVWSPSWHPMRTIVYVHELSNGAWHNLSSPGIEVPLHPAAFQLQLIDGKLYLIASASAITAVHAVSSVPARFSTIALPDGLENMNSGGYRMSRAHDSGFYLIHEKELQLHVLLHRMDSNSIDNWSLVKTICLRKVCGSLGLPTLASEDALNALVEVRAFGDNAEFVFLQVGDDILYIHINSRAAEKVYTVTPEDKYLLRLVPFMMIWPPILPNIKEVNDKMELPIL